MSNTKTELNSQIHAGRRQKLRDRFLKHGLESFNEYEVLEFALGYCIPRQDTNPAAHSLINTFGSLQAVMDAEPAALTAAFGIGDQAAVFLHFLKSFSGYLAKHNVNKVKIVKPDDAVKHLRPILRAYTVEQFVVLCLDKAGNVITVHNITNKELDMVHINVREIVAIVTNCKTAQIILAHNHLNEDPEPSMSDMQITRRLLLTFENLGIKLLDHLIFAVDKTYSFRDSGLLDLLKSGNPKLN